MFSRNVLLIVTIFAITTPIRGGDLYEGNACKMKSGQRGVCTVLKQCNSVDTGIKAKTFLIQDVVICSFVGQTEVICCPDKVDGTIPDINQHIFPNDPSTGPVTRISQRRTDKVCDQYKISYINLPKLIDFHILDGDPSYQGEFPHMAAVGYPVEAAGKTMVNFRCGGSLISERYVMTAAHCVDRPEMTPTIIRLGTIQLEDVSVDALDIGVEKVILHPEYKTSLRYNDIALIRLNSTVSFTSRIIFPACLDTDRTDTEANSDVIATGWGSTNITTRRRSDLLLKVTLSTVRLADCNQKHREYTRDKRLPNGLLEGQMCAYDPNLKKDTCEGDSGGPLQVKMDVNISKVLGITSFGLTCGSALPPVYTRVAFYLDWLEQIVWPNPV